MHFQSLSRQNFIGRVSLQTFWSSSSCAAVKTKHVGKKKYSTKQKCASMPKCVVLAPYAVLLCPSLEGNLAGRSAANDFGCSPRRKGGQNVCYVISCFFFFSELGEGKKKRHVDHIFWTRWAQETPSEALMEPQPVLVHGNHSSLH